MSLGCGNVRSRDLEPLRRGQRRRKIWSLSSKYPCPALLRCGDVNPNFLPILLEVIRNDIGIRHPNRLKTENPRHLLFVSKIGVAEFLEPGEIVEDRVIHAVI